MLDLLLAGSVISAAVFGATLLHPQEVVPITEGREIRQIVDIVEAGVRAQFEKDGFATRDAHAKHYGCVNLTVA